MLSLLISLKIAWTALMLNKVRSILTLLGIIIGVGAVIAIVSLGEGLRSEFEKSINELGTNVLFLTPKAPKRPGQAAGRMELFEMEDLEAIEVHCPTIDFILPGIVAGVTAKYRNKTIDAQVMGGYPEWLDQTPTENLESGRWLNRSDLNGRSRVAVIGDDLADELFDEWEDPVGKRVKLNGVTYEIIGKLSHSSNTFAGGPDTNESFLVPLTTVQHRILGSEKVFWVTLNLVEGASLEAAKEEVGAIMRQRRRVRNVADDNFQFISPDDFAAITDQFVNVLIGIFGSIAFISLLVGGVGIMNIMLVSVTERTREIGLRMAIGAGRPTVLLQFLVEAIMLTLSGGILGLVMGYAGAFGISKVLEQAMDASWNPVIPMVWVGYAVGVSVLIGVIFGTYPAMKASQLDPVEAMRYE